MSLPTLSKRAAYLTIDNVKRRNALSLGVLRSLRDQLHNFNRGPDGKVNILPPFKPEIVDELEAASKTGAKSDYSWLLSVDEWRKAREGLPNVLVLRTEGPVFSSGHDLAELRKLPYEEVKEAFALCAEVMSLVRRSPAPVVAVVQGLATAAGAQLAFTTDFPIALGTTKFQLPGASIGLPCTSPSTAVSRRLGSAFTYRMLAMAEPVEARNLPSGAVEVVENESQLEDRVAHIVSRLAEQTAGQPQAFGKWAYWTHLSFNGANRCGADGYEDAVAWAGRVMALHARSADAIEGVNSFFEKRQPQWQS
ncbi:hypothetical protein LTR70_003196 [Exophiala xenobiotica]|uniref:Enoyl-CoA hydratase domain-containing protein 3, mitochondrial n=1 Tax=Lithohypha guttulata TaxID=1690604 RepID=A0ABR0KGU0_9EURO|nr:hypothetical protein LTR24_002841 [Lithohypha guttulata]KAK5323708.1 hypothetical protein LTR70_003196 [Exophiala xenobiotica]